MKVLKISLGLFLVMLMLLPAGCGKKKDFPLVAPDFALVDLSGRVVKLSDFKGKVVILDFWATWCPPCREEIPHFIDLQKKYGMNGLVVIGVAVDESEMKEIKPFAVRNQINYPVLFADESVRSAYSIRGIPATFIINKQGEIVQKFVGYRDKEIFEKEIKGLL